MKAKTIIVVVLLASLFLTACGTASGGDVALAAVEPEVIETTQDEKMSNLGQTTEDPDTSMSADVPKVSQAMQLALGTFKLDETSYPIDANQAAGLLPLWKAARTLSASETTATQEIEAVLKQIQNTLTPEQLGAILAMDLTMQDMDTIADELGLDLVGIGGGLGNMSPEMQATMQAARESAQGPPEGMAFPGAGGRPGGETGLSPDARQTAMAERGVSRGATMGLNPALLDAIIEFLEAKVL